MFSRLHGKGSKVTELPLELNTDTRILWEGPPLAFSLFEDVIGVAKYKTVKKDHSVLCFIAVRKGFVRDYRVRLELSSINFKQSHIDDDDMIDIYRAYETKDVERIAFYKLKYSNPPLPKEL